MVLNLESVTNCLKSKGLSPKLRKFGNTTNIVVTLKPKTTFTVAKDPLNQEKWYAELWNRNVLAKWDSLDSTSLLLAVDYCLNFINPLEINTNNVQHTEQIQTPTDSQISTTTLAKRNTIVPWLIGGLAFCILAVPVSYSIGAANCANPNSDRNQSSLPLFKNN